MTPRPPEWKPHLVETVVNGVALVVWRSKGMELALRGAERDGPRYERFLDKCWNASERAKVGDAPRHARRDRHEMRPSRKSA